MIDELIDKIKKSAMIMSLTNDKFENLMGCSSTNRHKFTPSLLLDTLIIEECLINGFAKRTNRNLNAFKNAINTKELNFDIPKKPIEAYKFITDINKKISKLDYHNENFIKFTTQVSAHECIGFLENTSKKYNIPINCGLKTEIIFIQALEVYNVGQLISLLWSAVKIGLAKIEGCSISRGVIPP